MATINLSIALVHYPVTNKNGEVIASAVTNLDLHDMARSARTYGVKGFYVVTPLEDQKALAAQLMREPGLADDVSFHILGASEYVKSTAFKDLIASLGIEGIIHCRPYVPHSEAIDAMIAADVLLLLQPHRSTNFQIPAKLFEYIATGNPIITIAPEGSATFNVVSAFAVGAACDPADRESICRSIMAAVDGTIQIPPPESVEYFSASGTTKRFAAIIDGLLAKPLYNDKG